MPGPGAAAAGCCPLMRPTLIRSRWVCLSASCVGLLLHDCRAPCPWRVDRGAVVGPAAPVVVADGELVQRAEAFDFGGVCGDDPPVARPGLDRLRDHAALAELDIVLVTAPDRLARNYFHQVLLIDELAARGCQVEFLDGPMNADPHDQLLLQIRGAVAEYERYAELGIALVMPTARLCRPDS